MSDLGICPAVFQTLNFQTYGIELNDSAYVVVTKGWDQ